ncbi:MAG: glycerophosphodiester phosphodiesterase [Cyclobacteriaceae bacterium]
MRDLGTRAVSSLALLSLMWSCISEQDLLTNNHFIVGEERPWVIAHGGSKDLFPENTMVAFDGSMEIGVDALEMDVKMTADDSLICHHDDTIDRMSNGEGSVNDLTYNDLLAFNFGDGFVDLEGNNPYQEEHVGVTLLEAVFHKYPNVNYVVEIKDSGEIGMKAAEKLRRLLTEYDLFNQIIVASFHDEVLLYLNSMDGPTIPISAGAEEAKDFVIAAKFAGRIFYSPDAVAFQLPMKQSGFNLTKQRLLNSAHKHNMAIHYWTIDDVDDMRRLIENGADGLITDRPDLMNELLDEMGY